jgi:acyl-CoA synthetase (NDP forming)
VSEATSPSTFVDEAQIYQLLAQAGFSVARHLLWHSADDDAKLPFEPGCELVLKAVAEELWHKSDVGGVRVIRWPEQSIAELEAQMRPSIEKDHPWRGLLVCEKLEWNKSGLPCEGFMSLRWDENCGWVCTLGLGGLHTELWARELRAGVLQWPLALCTVDSAMAELKASLLGRIWLGRYRQGAALLERSALRRFVEAIFALPEQLERAQLGLLECNPVVPSRGELVAIDGVGQRAAISPMQSEALSLRALTHPRRVAVVGVSERAGNVGRIISENLARSRLAEQGEVFILKDGPTQLFGLPCLPNVQALREKPVDLLVLSLPAPLTVELLEQLVAQGGGAEIVYLVAGGIGDGADKEGWGKRVLATLHQARAEGRWTPRLIGPNGLGMVNAPLGMNTLFIPEDKLQVQLDAQAKLGFVSQSGAFLVMCLSNEPMLPVRYALSIGNQIDLRFSAILAALREDPAVEVAALYAEGFAPGDSLATALELRRWAQAKRPVVVFKGGRTQAGMKAAAGHTGAMAADYDVQRRLFESAGAIICERSDEYSSVLAWLCAYPRFEGRCVAFMTNAGYESVASQDQLVAPLVAARLDDESHAKLAAAIAEHKLSALVSATLPLDLTPMANEAAYLACLRVLAQSAAEVLLVSLVPLTRQLETVDTARMEAFAAELRQVAEQIGKPVGVVVDSGELFEEYRKAMMRAGLPTFRRLEDAVAGLKLLARRA